MNGGEIGLIVLMLINLVTHLTMYCKQILNAGSKEHFAKYTVKEPIQVGKISSCHL